MKAVILLGHGSRDPLWREPMDAVASRVAARGVAVRCAFVELQEPDLAAAAAALVREGATHLTVVPLFLGAGRHARVDVPRMADDLRRTHESLVIELRPFVGDDARVLDLLASIASE
ncbi:MAG TPA: CbiX/SirB N-terminal domain-containing protein [Ramlibacter sp.]|uniref:sirohydrochlorin chelatase n=1 Tax=Ramlibacter sp. TaxID=1917967 RepID=UPI002BDE53B3|nr:CbiX/SirB N-terminal domain-containing protein [Ramlibacter sp.]HVZ43256.1 CbiX/SirB N-terminal domain-containing protein [Ramlibacter sp.]